MRPVLAVVLVVAGLILVVGALNHAQRVSLDCVVGTWSHASVFSLAAIVAGLLVATAVLAVAAAGGRGADDRRKLETELEHTYTRLRAVEGQPASANEQMREGALPAGDTPQSEEHLGVEGGETPIS